jgi:RNA polymerase sigma factor (sigma-70 family)
LKPGGRAIYDGGDFVQQAVRRFGAALSLYAQKLTGRGRADDVVQEVFLRLCRAERTQVEPHLAQWLYTVCRNLAFDHRRRSRHMTTTQLPPTLNGHAGDDPAVRVEQRDSQVRAMDLLADLPPNQQEALRLKFQHGLTYKEIAAVMGDSESNVGWLIHSGLKTMRVRMSVVRT